MTATAAAPDPAGSARPHRAGWLCALALACALGFAALGVWQGQRLGWKQALISRVERQLAAAPQPLPPPAQWPALQREADEYRRLALTARLDPARAVRVLASTVLGRGHWLMVPAELADGRWLWVNRGFVPEALAAGEVLTPVPAGPVALSGLLRWTEPPGRLWLDNAPAQGRWISRELPAMSAATGLPADQVAPFFLDLAEQPGTQAAAGPAGYPRAGLTVLRFSNNHLVYAVTWWVLALGSAAAAAWLWRGSPGGDADADADADIDAEAPAPARTPA